MILKISTSDGWRFISNVKSVQVNMVALDEYNKDFKGMPGRFDDVFLHYHLLQADGELTRKNEENRPTVIIMYPQFNDGTIERYIADLAVYLMSEEGKTIERIN